MASLMASKTLLLPTPNPTFRAHHNQPLSTLSLPFRKPLAFSLHKFKPYSSFNPILKPAIVSSSSSSSSCSSPTLPNNQSSNPVNLTCSPLSDSTHTISTILALAVSFSGAFIKLITKFSLKIKENVLTPNPDELTEIQNLQKSLVASMFSLSLCIQFLRQSFLCNVCVQEEVEETYIMVKPDERGLVGEIISRFVKKGFKLTGLKLFQCPQELAEMLRDLCLQEEVSKVNAPTVYCKKLKSADFVTDGMHQKCGTSS